jgi:hypothetical protein
MPLPVPNLDDRSFPDLVEELVARIPAHTPEWTNPAVGDPGRTLIELFAWLTDTLLYRVNLIPERQRLAFLRLLGLGLRPATPARTLVSIGFGQPEQTATLRLAPRTRLKAAMPFETVEELVVLPVVGELYRKRPLTPAEARALAPRIEALKRLYPVEREAVPYVTTPVCGDGRPEPDGVDLVSGTVDQALWFALLAPPVKHPDFARLRAALSPAANGVPQVLNVGFAPALTLPAFGEGAAPRPPVPHVWEVCVKSGAQPAGYRELKVAADTTRGLTADGVVRLTLPDAADLYVPPNDVTADVDAGTGDRPPRLDDPDKAARLLGWLRLRPTTDLDSFKVSWAELNAVTVEQRQTLANLVVGAGTGAADLEVKLPATSVEEAGFRLEVEEPGRGFLRWQPVADLALAGPDDAAFHLNPEAGTVRFGDGVHGRVPARGARIKVAQMRAGGGQAGNLAPGVLTAVDVAAGPTLKVWQPLPARGGQDAETLAEAEQRIPAVFRHRQRAITPDDYAELARATPGVRVGRVEVLPRFKPQQRRFDVPGVVSVMALPARDTFEPPYPRVDRPFIEAVYAQLEPRKPLGVELYVIGCEYVPLALSVGVDNPSGDQATLAAVQDALRRYLFALPPGGPEGGGWPLGRTVRRRELEIVVSRVPGVSGVYGPNLFTPTPSGWQKVVAADGNESAEVPLQPWQLPELLAVVVATGPAPEEVKPPAPAKARAGLAIPVVPEVC